MMVADFQVYDTMQNTCNSLFVYGTRMMGRSGANYAECFGSTTTYYTIQYITSDGVKDGGLQR